MFRFRIAALVAVAVFASCGGDSGGGSPTGPGPGPGPGPGTGAVARVELTETSLSISPGVSIQVQARAYDATSHALESQTFTWSSNATGVATVNNAGLVTGVSHGNATITASTGGKSATLAVTVANPAPTITAIDPLTVPINTAATLRIIGSGFMTTTQARLNGSNRPTTFVSATEVRMVVAASDVPTAATYQVSVVNPAPGGGPSNTVVFNAVGAPPTAFICPALNLTFPSTISGSLAATDCKLNDNTYFDFYSFTLAAQQQVTFSMSGGTAIDAYLLLVSQQDVIVAQNDDNTPADRSSTMRVILPPGTWRVAANSAIANQFGPYVLNAVASNTPTASNCAQVWVVKGVVVEEGVSNTDCVSAGFYSDRYFLTLTAGQSVTITMTSNEVNAFLELFASNGTSIAQNNDGAGGTNARITFTASSAGIFIIDAGTNTAGTSGSYQLTIQ